MGWEDLTPVRFRPDGPRSWAQVRTLVDLGELTARWVLGEIDVVAGQYCKPDPETAKIADYLVALNLLGLVTDFSQPGKYPEGEQLTGQRAAATGWCTRENARRLTRVTLERDLIVVVNAPGAYCYTQIPVTIDLGGPADGRSDACAIWDTAEDTGGAYTFVGSGMNDDDLDGSFGQICPPDALKAIRSSWYVEAVDPVWGRPDVMKERSAAPA